MKPLYQFMDTVSGSWFGDIGYRTLAIFQIFAEKTFRLNFPLGFQRKSSLAQFLTKTWYPKLFPVLRNLRDKVKN